MTLNTNDTFKITTGYGKRILTVVEITNDAFEYKCTDENGEVFFISEKALEIYESLKQLVIISRAPQTKKIENARKALASAHVQTVEVGFENESDGVRFYSAVTKDNGVPHLYTVRVWEDSDGATFARCNCLAKTTCRHIAKVAQVDAARCNRNVFYGSFEGYRAHRQPQRLAA